MTLPGEPNCSLPSPSPEAHASSLHPMEKPASTNLIPGRRFFITIAPLLVGVPLIQGCPSPQGPGTIETNTPEKVPPKGTLATLPTKDLKALDTRERWQEFLLRRTHYFSDPEFTGSVELWSSRHDGQLRFRLSSSAPGPWKKTILPPVGLEGFSPTNFILLNGSSSILSGSYGTTGKSALVQIDYDLELVQQNAKLLCVLPRDFPILELCLEKASQPTNLFWLEDISKDIYCFSFKDHRVRLFASSKTYPKLKTARNLWVSPLDAGGRMVTASPHEFIGIHSRLPAEKNVSFIDQDDDLKADPSGFG